MCTVLAGLTALTGAMQIKANNEAAEAQAAANRSQAEMYSRNADIERRQQEQIADNAAIRDRQLRQNQRLHAAQVRAAAGAAGISSDYGSPLDILSSGWDAYQQDKMISLANQRNANYDKRVSESNMRYQASAHNAAADNIMASARTQNFATILGTASAIAGSGAFDNINSTSKGTSWPSGTSISSGNTYFNKVGTNTASMYSPGSGYSFFPMKSYKNNQQTFFPYK